MFWGQYPHAPAWWIGSCMQQSLHFRGCFWRQLPNSRHRQAIAKQSDFHAFVCSVRHGNSEVFFLGRTLLWLKISAMSSYDLSPWLWSLQTSAPVRQTIQRVPSPSPSLSSLFHPWLSKSLANMMCTQDRASKSGNKAKETSLHIIFIISRFILWQLHVISSSFFTRS